MLLRNLLSAEINQSIDIEINGNKIQQVTGSANNLHKTNSAEEITFENAIVFPGLINSHEHLDFNCLPKLGNKTYENYVEWGKDIHAKNKDTIEKSLKIPQQLRIQWGLYKNLLNGFTTVVNHGEKIFQQEPVVSIFQQCHILHSVQLEKQWKVKLNNPFKFSMPYTIHVGEGSDEKSHQEINDLIRWNLTRKKLIGIHAIVMNIEQARAFEAIIWCPDSNKFLIDKTADIAQLKKYTHILFGTDSTVSASWKLHDHLQVAKQYNMASNEEIFNMLTKNAAKVWKLEKCGEIKAGFKADLVVAKAKKSTAMDSFFDIQPEDILLVLHDGKIKLFDAEFYNAITEKNIATENYSCVQLNGTKKYAWGNLPALISNIRKYYPEAFFPVN